MHEAELFLEKMARSAPRELSVGGVVLRPGSRVRLRPRPGGDLLDTALAGQVALIEGIEVDDAGTPHLTVVLEDDPGRDLGRVRHPAHRFFFAPGELEPLDPVAEGCLAPAAPLRILVAGIGNLFLGDDGFGVAVARRLAGRTLPTGTELADFGIRGLELAYALGGYDAAILVDAVPRGLPPGSVSLIEPDREEDSGDPVDSHRMDPLAVLALARQLGPVPAKLLIVGCEPETPRGAGDHLSMSMELSCRVQEAVERAADLVVQVAERLAAGESGVEAPAGE